MDKTCQNFRWETKIPTCYKGVFRILSKIWDRAFCENSYWLKAVDYFPKTLHLGCLKKFWIPLCYIQATCLVPEKEFLTKIKIYDALHDLVPFAQFKKRENTEIDLLKVNDRNRRTRCEICSKSTIKTNGVLCFYC